ncbi:unnamed protein product [Triticum turgidum subsp. durum]|uniref:FAD-binding PCMH-type domain-containing protein n=1 Tax=Triticum turgidum subsp. durum TaxID=4567 RepID=A0A9R0ZK25_TRITD|nr:unnamed protein product [Triticum turgidum subsp. durum]
MATLRGRGLALAFLASLLLSVHLAMASSDDFLQCVRDKIPGELVYTQCSSSFSGVLVNYIKNAKFVNTTAKPLCIVTPTDASHVQAAIRCGRGHGVRLRVRSGGHDYEGLSYRSARQEVFGLLDLAALRAVSVDEAASTAWVESGATIGELYYAVAKNNPRLAFPSGECPTIGVGGHFSGGGIGMMMRKYGLSIDRVVDAKLVNANGELLDRAGMGEDLFWAIRGGGGGNFGVVLSWKVQLVPVPATVTVFNIAKTLEQGAVDILTRWQDVAPALPSELTITVMVTGQQAVFRALYLGECGSLASTMRDRFPELNMTSADCQPMTWLQSAALSFFSFTNSKPVEDVLLPRPASPSTFSKGKSDYVRQAIPKAVWKEVYASWFTMTARGAVRDPVHRVLDERGRRAGGDELAGRVLRVHGAPRDEAPAGGVRQLPGPGHRAERAGGGGRLGRRRERPLLGPALLPGQLREARQGEGRRRSHQLLPERAEHPAHAQPATRVSTEQSRVARQGKASIGSSTN